MAAFKIEMGRRVLLVFFNLIWLVSSQEMKAKLNSYNIQVTAHDDGTMFKFISPESDVQNSLLKEPPDVQITDMVYPVTLLTPKSATALIINPKMSIDGKMPEYTYKPAKSNPKIYNMLQLLHTHHDVEPIVQTFTANTLKSHQALENKKLQESAELKEVDFDDNKDGSGEEIEVASDEKTEPNEPTNQPPKLMSSLSLKKKKKPCTEATCAEQKENGGEEGENEEESAPQPDIPIELGLAPGDGQDTDEENGDDDGYKVTYIDRKTPENFIMLEPKITTRQKSTSASPAETTLRRERRDVDEELMRAHNNHHHHHHHKRHTSLRHKRNKIQVRQKKNKLQKQYLTTKSSAKRGLVNVDKSLPQTIQHLNITEVVEKSKFPEGRIVRPVQAYIRTLSKDINNVMAQAKQVLQNTGQVVHGLKKIVGGASILSTVAGDAAKYGKYLNLDPKNSTLEYLQEQAIVALITAEQSSREAQEAALIAKTASEKATNIARRMNIAKSYPSQQSVDHLTDMTTSQSSQAEKAARFASIQGEKTRKVSSFINATIKRMSKLMSPQRKTVSVTNLPTNSKRYTESNVKSILNKTKPAVADPDYADFKEQLSVYVKAATETSHQAKNETSKASSRNLQANAAASKKKEIVQKPTTFTKVVHLRPGEYTGFKRSMIETGGNTMQRDVEAIKRFKTIGKVEDDNEHEEKEDMDQEDEKEDEVESSEARKNIPMKGVIKMPRDEEKNLSTPLIIQKTFGKLRKYNDTEISTQDIKNEWKKNITVENKQTRPSQGYHQGSGSGDGEDIRGVDLTKFLKAPITVSVHITKQNEDGSEDAGVKKQEKEDEQDPFGFTKGNAKRRDGNKAGDADDVVIDPFGFNKLDHDSENHRKYFSKTKQNSNEKTTFDWD